MSGDEHQHACWWSTPTRQGNILLAPVGFHPFNHVDSFFCDKLGSSLWIQCRLFSVKIIFAPSIRLTQSVISANVTHQPFKITSVAHMAQCPCHLCWGMQTGKLTYEEAIKHHDREGWILAIGSSTWNWFFYCFTRVFHWAFHRHDGDTKNAGGIQSKNGSRIWGHAMHPRS